MNIVPYRAEHLMALSLQEAQAHLVPYLDYDRAKSLEAVQSFTGLIDGCPVICAGAIELEPHRALVWSFVGDTAGCEFVNIHKAVLRFLKAAPYSRIEATTDADFKQGHRWLRLLGFKLEARRMRGYYPDGRDAALYARVN